MRNLQHVEVKCTMKIVQKKGSREMKVCTHKAFYVKRYITVKR